MSRKLYITGPDKEKLLKLIDSDPELKEKNKQYIKDLELELERAAVVDPGHVPGNVITMNTKVLLRFDDAREDAAYTLVYPAEAAIRENKISVLSPIGTALLGYKAGDVIQWKVPDGTARIHVMEVLYQPEAAGDMEL
ncbi:MAG TPA: nucleoside diphosphate kinase regulator [Peptococcaceae bacterium]|nr:nucleoside diphosphate kinase regulator [Peptococcaceae bacterium]